MLLCPITREDLLRMLPKGGEVAEIGVAKGEFSQSILANAAPRKLHLIDPWAHQDRADYVSDPNNAEDAEQTQRYQGVLAQFAAEIRSQRVEVHQAYSQDVAASFAPGQFDWIYVDGLHSYDGVSSDLRHYKDKVKPEGLIIGHDYTNHTRAQEMNFGVIEAVNDFATAEGFHMIALTHEAFPTYVLCRRLDGPWVEHLLGHLLFHVSGIVEIRDYPAGNPFQHKIVAVGGQARTLLSF
jgi:predicted O-methyltransferase YrrM